MGVDAQMLVKVPNGALTEADAVRIGYELAATIGPNHFMITRGGDPELAFGAPHHAVSLVWLRRRFPGGEVWYGGDSSGICAELMTDERLRRLDDHFYAHGRRPYVRYKQSGSDTLIGHRAPVCGCADVATVHTGGGRDRSFWWCDGCGAAYITSARAPHGIRLNRNEHVFAGNRRLEAEGLL